jgi:hypothetical protein
VTLAGIDNFEEVQEFVKNNSRTMYGYFFNEIDTIPLISLSVDISLARQQPVRSLLLQTIQGH